MNRKATRWIVVLMAMVFVLSQLCCGVYAEETVLMAAEGVEEPPAEPAPEPVPEPEPVTEPVTVAPEPVTVAPEPVTQAPAPEPEPVTEPVTAAPEPATQAPAPEPATAAPEPVTQDQSGTNGGSGEYDSEGIDPSQLADYLYEMGMGEWADSISDGTEAGGVANYTWGLNTLTREPAELKGYNFAVFGLSGENSGDNGRSDTIIIVTIDPEHKEIKLTSILRDTKASIEGHEPQKINAALMIGGPKLAVETLNKNFGLTLKDFVTVRFETLSEIVDILGGLEIELSQDEADFINEYSAEYGIEPISEGVQTLNGVQCVIYCRIRKIDSDKVRAGRQQLVIQKIFEKLRGSGFIEWLRIVFKVLETSQISMSLGDIISVISLPLGEYTLVKNVVPDIEYETDLKTAIDEHGEWVWLYDLGKAGDRIVDIINNQ